MRFITNIVLLLSLAVFAKTKPNSLTPRIINGNEALENQFPYQVALYLTTSPSEGFFCAGALISEQWILTTAACLHLVSSDTLIITSVGSNLLSEDDDNRIVDIVGEYYLHEEYDSETLNNNIAAASVMELLPINGINIKPIALAASEVSPNSKVTVTGWGLTELSGKLSEALRFADLVAISNEACAESFAYMPEGMICAQSNTESAFQTACDGDAGDPLVALDENGNATLVGLASFGASAGCVEPFPVGFTSIFVHRQWINKVTDL